MVLLGEPELKETPFLVLANKSDLVHAQSSENVRESLALDQLERHISVSALTVCISLMGLQNLLSPKFDVPLT